MHGSHKQPVLYDFPYCEDSSILFDSLKHRPWAVFLDSGSPAFTDGRYDILTAEPEISIVTRGAITKVTNNSGTIELTEDPFILLQNLLGPVTAGRAEVPFCGGAIGYFGYDLGRRLERLPTLALDSQKLPEMAIGIYNWALIVDHHLRHSWLLSKNGTDIERYRTVLLDASNRVDTGGSRKTFRLSEPVTSNMSRTEYLSSFSRIKRYITEGDCYQVNLTQRFSAPATGDAWQLYRGLRKLNAAPFGAYFNTPYCQIACSSPERFLKVRNSQAETRPIKGTIARSNRSEEDLKLAEILSNSTKDRAENLMIVDLLRNDLGKVCVYGSIQVPELFKIESYVKVHHLVSTVRGTLAEGQSALTLLRACFPGGSITGAPKLRAMQIIEELEPHRRGIYCGAIGYISFDGSMDTNIVIRTLVHGGGLLTLGAGGGIVADSEPEAEYQETYHKVAAQLQMLELYRV